MTDKEIVSFKPYYNLEYWSKNVDILITLNELKEFLELTHLLEAKRSKTNNSKAYITELLADHESIIIHCRENIHYFGNELKDFGTSDFITNLMLVHEKMAYLLRAHLN